VCITDHPRAYPTPNSMFPSPCNCLQLIVMEPGQRIVQDPRIHCHMILSPHALVPNRWAPRLAWLHGHIVVCQQMLHQVVFGVYNVLHPSTLQTNLGPSLAQWTPSMATRRGATKSMVTPFMVTGRGATTFETKKTNTLNLM
jgi:hypothetical protein